MAKIGSEVASSLKGFSNPLFANSGGGSRFRESQGASSLPLTDTGIMNLALGRRRLPQLPEPQQSSPRRGKRLFLLAAVLGLLWFPALTLDLPLAKLVKSERAPGELHKLLTISEVFAHGLGIVAILATAAALDARRWRVLPRLVACSLGAGLAADTLKLLLARWRPKSAPLDGTVWETFAGWFPAWNEASLPQEWNAALQSLPSGHTAAGVGLAIGLSALYPRGRWLFAVFAALAAVQRIESQSHFLSDILAGAAVGAVVAGICLSPRLLGDWFGRWEMAPTSAGVEPVSEIRPR